MSVPSTYKGPVYPGKDAITEDWVLELLEYMKEGKVIDKKSGYMMVLDTLNILKTHKTVEYIDLPDAHELTTCGDVHGQYYDLLSIWELNGHPSRDNPYLFNGDFVDRGSFSAEIII